METCVPKINAGVPEEEDAPRTNEKIAAAVRLRVGVGAAVRVFVEPMELWHIECEGEGECSIITNA
jgi:hypothetical protein